VTNISIVNANYENNIQQTGGAT